MKTLLEKLFSAMTNPVSGSSVTVSIPHKRQRKIVSSRVLSPECANIRGVSAKKLEGIRRTPAP